MPEVKTVNEIAADMTIAMLKYTGLKQAIAHHDHKVRAERLAEVYKIIRKAVSKSTS
ncbi:MAG: hypothetical protein JSW24_03360 [Dehalococcoidia bacterium]|nr:MAG: hypothetical protein JSW24_03360 [Dehalococcoidia bacterium]